MPTTTKPATKPRAKPQHRKPAAAKAVNPAPSAMFDPADAPSGQAAPIETGAPSVASEPAGPEPVSPEPPVIEEAPPAAPTVTAPAETPASSDGPVRVRLGQAEGLLHRAPIGLVQDLLAGCADRIEAGRSSPSIALLQERMRGTEGRCAPVVFSQPCPQSAPDVLAGVESVSAALNLGFDHVFVLIIDGEDAGAVQRHIAASAMGLPLSSKTDCYSVIE